MNFPARKLIPGAICIALLATPTFAQTASEPERKSQQDEAAGSPPMAGTK